MNSRALVIAIVIGTVLQLIMVLVGHTQPAVAHLFAVGGTGISFVAGLVYTLQARGGTIGTNVLGGLVAGALCALIGIIVSYALKDVDAAVLAFGTGGSAVTGAIGGAVGRFFTRA